MKYYRTVAGTMTGRAYPRIASGTESGPNRLAIPMTQKVVKTFDPRRFPTAISTSSGRAAARLTATSAREVPIASAVTATSSAPI